MLGGLRTVEGAGKLQQTVNKKCHVFARAEYIHIYIYKMYVVCYIHVYIYMYRVLPKKRLLVKVF